MKCLHLPVRAGDKVLLLVTWVWLVLPSACCHWNVGPGKSTGAPRKTTPRQDRALLRMVRQDCFISAQDLMVQMRNFYGMRAGQETINNRLLFHGYHAYIPTRKPLLTANHCRLHLEWAEKWQNLTMGSMSSSVVSPDSNPVDGRLRVSRLPGEHF